MTFCTFLLMDRLMVGREILTCCCTEEEFPPEAFYPAGPPTLLVFDVLVVPVFQRGRPMVITMRSWLAAPCSAGGCSGRAANGAIRHPVDSLTFAF